VHPLAKPILIALGALVALAAIATLGLNLYLQSSGVQQRLAAAVSSGAGAAPTIGATYYTPWSGLVVSGVKVPPQPGSNRPMLEIPTLKLRIALGELFAGRLVIENIDIIEPVLVLARQPGGTWVEKKSPAPASLSAVPEPSEPIAQTTTTAEAPVATAPEPTEPKKSETRLEAFQVKNGTAIFYTHAGMPSLKVEGLDIESAPSPDGGITGKFRLARASIHGAIQPRDINGTFSWKDGRLAIPDLKGSWADGEIAGAFELLPDPAFRASISADNVSLQKFAADSGVEPGNTGGTFRGELALRGIPGSPETFLGGGKAVLSEARVEPVDFIRQLGELLRIEELRLLELGTAEADFSIRDGTVVVDRLVTVTENLMMDATGTIDFAGALDLDARFHVNDKLRRETRGLLGTNLKPSEQAGYTHMPFQVGGTLAKPKTDLLDKLVGVRIGQDVGGFLKSILRMPGTKKQPKPTPAPQPAN